MTWKGVAEWTGGNPLQAEYVRSVNQAEQGADFDFLTSRGPGAEGKRD